MDKIDEMAGVMQKAIEVNKNSWECLKSSIN